MIKIMNSTFNLDTTTNPTTTYNFTTSPYPMMIKENQYRGLFQQLNEEQRAIFEI